MTDASQDGNERRDRDLRKLGMAAAELSHELRNLLVGVLSNAEILKSGKAADPLALAENIHRSALSCKALVDDVLTFSAGPETEFELVDLVQVVKELDASLPGESSLDFRFRSGALESALVDGRSQELERLLLNLLRNAREAAPAGHVEVRLEERDGDFDLSVHDSGPGIPLAERESIFDAFFSKKKVGGTGLGLPLARRIAEAHGGRLSVSDSDLGGAAFHLSLPARAETDPGSGTEPSGADEGSELRILCVDDDETTLETYRMILELEGHEVRVETCGRDALRCLETEAVDVLLVDLRLPDLHARDLLKRLETVKPELARRVIFATGDLMNEESRRFLDATGNPYLSKPFRIEQLRLAIELVARRS